MDNITILENIKKYIQTKKQESEKQRKLTRFEYALEILDIEKIKEYLDDGISIEEFEKRESSFRKVLLGYEKYLFDIIEKYRRKNTKMKDWDFFSKYLKMSANDIPEELKEQIEAINKEVIDLLEQLYKRGADINHHTYLGSPVSIIDDLLDKKELHETASVMQVAYGVYSISKEKTLIDWVLEKKELVLEPKIVEYVINAANPDSDIILEKLMKRGFRGEPKDLSIFGLNEKTPLLVDVIINVDTIGNAKEKFNILWKYSTEEEKREIIENWNIDEFDLSGEYPQSSSGMKM